MTRVWHPYTVWEDWRAGMWLPPHDLDAEMAQAAAVLAAPPAFRAAARTMVTEWPIAAEHNLTDEGQNRRSWVGQATCCHLTGAREYSTRRAWWTLTDRQQTAANAVADQVIAEWAADRIPGLFPIPAQRGPARIPCQRTTEEVRRAEDAPGR